MTTRLDAAALNPQLPTSATSAAASGRIYANKVAGGAQSKTGSPLSTIAREGDHAIIDPIARLRLLNSGIDEAQKTDAAASSATDALNDIGDLLNELQALVSESGGVAAQGSADISGLQARIDQVLSSIESAEQIVRRAKPAVTVFAGTGVNPAVVLSASPYINPIDSRLLVSPGPNYDLFTNITARGSLPPGESQDVDLQVVASARHGTLHFDFGRNNLNLAGPNRHFTIEVAGARGTTEISFASGTSITSVMAAINSFSSQTGVSVRAEQYDPNGFWFQSADFGSDQFVSVRVLDSGGIQNFGSVQRSESIEEFRREYPPLATSLTDGAVFTDQGRDVGIVDPSGLATVRTHGTTAWFQYDSFVVSFDLRAIPSGHTDRAHAQQWGRLDGLFVRGVVPVDGDRAAAPQPDPLEHLLTQFDQLRANPSQRAASIAQLATAARDAASRISDARTTTLAPRLAQFKADLSALFAPPR